jgi:hypothetical protein
MFIKQILYEGVTGQTMEGDVLVPLHSEGHNFMLHNHIEAHDRYMEIHLSIEYIHGFLFKISAPKNTQEDLEVAYNIQD